MADMDENRYHFVETTPGEEAYYAAEAERMTDAYKVRGRMIPLLGILTSLSFCLLIPAWYGGLSERFTPIAALVIGALLSLFAIPCHLLGGSKDVISVGWVKSLLYLVGIAINTAGTSLCMMAYYLHLGKQPTHGELLLGFIAPVVLFGLVCILIQVKPDRYGLWTGLTCLLAVALIVVSIVFWVRSDSKVLFSFAFFDLLWTLIAVIALHVACSDEESPWLRFSSFAAFGVLMAVGSIVLIILVCASGGDGCDCDCGGDCCDCGDCGCGGTENGTGGGKMKRKTRRRLGM